MNYCMFENLLDDVEQILGAYYEGKLKDGVNQSEFDVSDRLQNILSELQDVVEEMREIGVKK